MSDTPAPRGGLRSVADSSQRARDERGLDQRRLRISFLESGPHTAGSRPKAQPAGATAVSARGVRQSSTRQTNELEQRLSDHAFSRPVESTAPRCMASPVRRYPTYAPTPPDAPPCRPYRSTPP